MLHLKLLLQYRDIYYKHINQKQLDKTEIHKHTTAIYHTLEYLRAASHIQDTRSFDYVNKNVSILL